QVLQAFRRRQDANPDLVFVGWDIESGRYPTLSQQCGYTPSPASRSRPTPIGRTPGLTLTEADKRALLSLYKQSQSLGIELFGWGDLDSSGQLRGGIRVPAPEELAIVKANPSGHASRHERLLLDDADFRVPMAIMKK